MCGFFGVTGKGPVADELINCLMKMEHQDFDATGIITATEQNTPLEKNRIRLQGLQKNHRKFIFGHSAIGKNYWVSNDRSNKHLSQPYVTDNNIAIALNGIILNYESIRDRLLKEGYTIKSDCDIEVIGLLIQHCFRLNNDPLRAIRAAVETLEGNYAIVLLNQQKPDYLYTIRNGSMMAIGLGHNKNFITSDLYALPTDAAHLIFPDDGDIAEVSPNGVTIYDAKNIITERPVRPVSPAGHDSNDFILPDAALLTLQGRISSSQITIESFGEKAPELLKEIDRVQIVGVGPGYYAGLMGGQWIEKISGIPCQVETSEEYRSRRKIKDHNKLFVSVSQTGEEPDTVSCLHLARNMGYAATLSICSTPMSSVVYNSDMTLMTGGHIAKAQSIEEGFTAQLAGLFLLSTALGRFHRLDKYAEYNMVKTLKQLPTILNKTLKLSEVIWKISKSVSQAKKIILVCGENQLPIALECAEKFRNNISNRTEALSYTQFNENPAEFIKTESVIVAIMPGDQIWHFFSGLNKNLIQTKDIIMITDIINPGDNIQFDRTVHIPKADELIFSFTAYVVMNLLAQYAGTLRKT